MSVVLEFGAASAYGQWTGTSTISCNPCNVVIGTANPLGKLHVTGLGAAAASTYNTYTVARFSDGGQVSNSAVIFDTGGTGATAFRGITIGKSAQNMLFGRFSADGNGAPVYDMTIDSNGNVGVGTITPSHKLAVNGPIRAKEIIVDTGWSDYVFQPGYKLMPLKDIARYVREHHHLPEVPSEKEVQENGVSRGEMQSKLLAKIEELTLHMIQAEERSNRLEEQNHQLQQRIAALESAPSEGK